MKSPIIVGLLVGIAFSVGRYTAPEPVFWREQSAKWRKLHGRVFDYWMECRRKSQSSTVGDKNG